MFMYTYMHKFHSTLLCLNLLYNLNKNMYQQFSRSWKHFQNIMTFSSYYYIYILILLKIKTKNKKRFFFTSFRFILWDRPHIWYSVLHHRSEFVAPRSTRWQCRGGVSRKGHRKIRVGRYYVFCLSCNITSHFTQRILAIYVKTMTLWRYRSKKNDVTMHLNVG